MMFGYKEKPNFTVENEKESRPRRRWISIRRRQRRQSSRTSDSGRDEPPARACLVALLLCFCSAAAADVAVPPLYGRVVDQTGTLSGGDVAALTQTLKDCETRKGSQIAVLIVPTTDQESIEQFSIRVAEAWKIGRRRSTTARCWSSPRTTGVCASRSATASRARSPTHHQAHHRRRHHAEIQVRRFRRRHFAGVDRMIRLIDGEKLPAPEPEHWRSPAS
jgi:uncharacterized protein